MSGLDDKQKKYSIPGVGAQTAFKRFRNGDLVAGIYYFDHKLQTKYPIIIVYDNLDTQIIPDFVIAVDENRVSVNLNTLAPITGVYKVRAVGA